MLRPASSTVRRSFFYTAGFDQHSAEPDAAGGGWDWVAVGFPSIEEQFAERVLENLDVRVNREGAEWILDHYGGGKPVFVVKARDRAGQQIVEVATRERQADADDEVVELADDASHALDGFLGVAGIFIDDLGAIGMPADELKAAKHDAEQIIEIVGDTLRHGANRGGPARLLYPAGEIEELAIDGDEATLRLHAGDRLLEVNGLGDVVHRFDAEALEFALFGGAVGDEDDGDGARVLVRLEALANLDAVHIRHHHIEEDQVGPILGDEG
jgi:hypothetical protein